MMISLGLGDGEAGAFCALLGPDVRHVLGWAALEPSVANHAVIELAGGVLDLFGAVLGYAAARCPVEFHSKCHVYSPFDFG
jgi:hypothetical protein